MNYKEIMKEIQNCYDEIRPLVAKHISELGDEGTEKLRSLYRKIEELKTQLWGEQ